MVSTAAGFEPAREYPNGFQVRLLNHSDKPPLNTVFTYYIGFEPTVPYLSE